jgi:transcriptional regulator with XRE-family HTH domain
MNQPPGGEEAARLRAARAWAGLQAQEMARALGISASTLNRKEKGKAPITPYEIDRVVERCDVPRWFMTAGWDGAEAPEEPAERVLLQQALDRAMQERDHLLSAKQQLEESEHESARAELARVMEGLHYLRGRIDTLLDDIATAHLAPVDEARALSAAGRLFDAPRGDRRHYIAQLEARVAENERLQAEWDALEGRAEGEGERKAVRDRLMVELHNMAGAMRLDVARVLALAANTFLTPEEEAAIEEGAELTRVLGLDRLRNASRNLAEAGDGTQQQETVGVVETLALEASIAELERTVAVAPAVPPPEVRRRLESRLEELEERLANQRGQIDSKLAKRIDRQLAQTRTMLRRLSGE